MWKSFKTEHDAESFLKAEGYRKRGQWWDRGEMHVSFSRVEIGQCNDGTWVTMHVEHNAMTGNAA